ncbi:MAG: hypothetical protein HZB16_13070 [Armatimonadetes bacterium]|nr:hypothetical protein [Armatimonadota bacterium]
MITYRCPGCGERLNVVESELDRQVECAACGMPSRCPASDYHKSRLRRLKSELAKRPLASAELREAAVHYRGLGQDDKARRAEKAARRAAETGVAEADSELAGAVAAVTADFADYEPAPAPHDALALAIGAAVWAGVTVGAALVHPAAVAPLFAHGLAAMAVAGACAVRGSAAGWTLLGGVLLGAPFGMAYGLLYRGSAPRHLPRADSGVALGMAVVTTAVWVGTAVHLLAVRLA